MPSKNQLQLDVLLENSSDFKKINPSLENIKKALELFANPHDDFESIIVAGTNGKGSVSSLLEQLYVNHTELKISKFISPHLISVTERISVNNQEITETQLANILIEINSKLDFELTYFEKLFLAACMYFSREKVDLAILEVGMGGRWDCANLISDTKRKATIITSIGLDHQEFLGDTLEKIKLEKEAIKRTDKGVPHFDYRDYEPDLLVEERNYQLALEVFESFENVSVNKNEVLNAFKARYRARFEYNNELNLLIDSAHNPQAAKELAAFCRRKFPNEKVELHLAFLDKDYIGFFEELVSLKIDKVFLYQLKESRAANASNLIKVLKKLYPELEIKQGVLREIVKENNLKIFSGSIYFCGEVLRLIAKNPS